MVRRKFLLSGVAAAGALLAAACTGGASPSEDDNSSGDDDIVVFTDDNRQSIKARLHHLRQQKSKPQNHAQSCLADFVAPLSSGRFGRVARRRACLLASTAVV